MLLMRGGEGGPAASSSAKLMRTELEFDIELARSRARAFCPAGRAGTDRFLYAPGMRIVGGTSEIQRNIIAERVLGLPREPRPGRSAGAPGLGGSPLIHDGGGAVVGSLERAPEAGIGGGIGERAADIEDPDGPAVVGEQRCELGSGRPPRPPGYR